MNVYQDCGCKSFQGALDTDLNYNWTLMPIIANNDFDFSFNVPLIILHFMCSYTKTSVGHNILVSSIADQEGNSRKGIRTHIFTL